MSDPRAIVQAVATRFQAGDRDGAFSLYDAGIRVQQPSTLPHGGWHVGLDGMTQMGATFAEHWDREITASRLLDADDPVVQVSTQTWTARSTGRSATVDVVELLTVRDDRITEIRVFQQDTALLLATL